MVTCEENIDTIKDTYNRIHDFYKNTIIGNSFEEKTNKLLHNILAFKDTTKKLSNGLDEIVLSLESLTWIENPDANALAQINETIKLANNCLTRCLDNYALINKTEKKNSAKIEVKKFKQSIEDLKEIIIDLEKVFFVYPHDNEIKELNNQLLSL